MGLLGIPRAPTRGTESVHHCNKFSEATPLQGLLLAEFYANWRRDIVCHWPNGEILCIPRSKTWGNLRVNFHTEF
jgi:hypothetical protein